MKLLITERQFNVIANTFLKETIQQADKYYFNNGLLDDNSRNTIIGITNGDNWTKIVTDLYYANFLKGVKSEANKNEIKIFHDLLKKYDKNVFPIKELNENINSKNVIQVFISFLIRSKIVNIVQDLPSIAKRNVKDEIKKERDLNDLDYLKYKFEKFHSSYKSIINTWKNSPEWVDSMNRQLFKSKHTMEDWFKYVNDLEERVKGDYGKHYIKEIIKSRNDLELLFDNDDRLLIKVTSQEGIAKIGCNALWCFVKSEHDWLSYSYDGMVYVIADLTESPFYDSKSDDEDEYNDGEFVRLGVIIHKINFEDENDNVDTIYSDSNIALNNPIQFLRETIGIENAKKYITFK